MVAYTRAGKLAKNDEEYNEAGNPTPELVRVDDLVSEQRYEECRDGDYENTCEAWHIIVHRVYQLGTNDGVHRRPANARQNVEHSN